MNRPVIGLEIHIQLLTKSKMFCSCSTNFGDQPNTNICPICLGYPGTLPVLNQSVVDLVIKLGLALHCKINLSSDFSRKNYFYPDLPKGYQITQFNTPIAEEGYIVAHGKIIHITHIQLEEDSAKMFHGEGRSDTYIDFNRAGIPLIEVVTEPDIENEVQAGDFLEKLLAIVEYLEISNCKMEEGALRCDVNISMTKANGELGTKVEIKNLNSFRSITKAIQYEIKRQTEAIKHSKTIETETRSFDDTLDCTTLMRKKAGMHDYRYFADPDLGRLKIDLETVDSLKKNLPELPEQALSRLTAKLGLSPSDARIIVESKDLLNFFDQCCLLYTDEKTIFNWISTTLLKFLNQNNQSITDISLTPANFVQMLTLLDKGVISGKIGKIILETMIKTGRSPYQIILEDGLEQLSDQEYLMELIEQLIETYPKEIQSYKEGKKNLLDMFMGEIMNKTDGKANPGLLKDLLIKKLLPPN